MSSPDDRHRRPVSRAAWALAAALVVLAGFVSPAGAAGQADGQWWHTQWRMDEVWSINRGSGVTVAVLDSGVNASVPELAGAVVPGTDFVGDSDGTVDRDDFGHGTAMATLIAGRGGDRGIRGVAPEATILPVTVSRGGETGPGPDISADRFSRGIRYAADQDATVVNLSQAITDPLAGEDGCPEPVAEAVRYAASQDVIVVAGSGNVPDGSLMFPATCPGVLTVGANDQQLQPWVNSYRSDYVDVSAAGVGLQLVGRDGQTYTGDGTSASTALVSGAVALVRAELPDASAADVLARILHTVRDIHIDGHDEATGYGVVRPFQALTESVPPDATNPVWMELEASAPAPTPTPSPTPAATSPGLAQGPPSDEGGLTPGAGLAIAFAGLLGLAVLAAVVVLVVVLTRRRPATAGRHPQPPAGPPGPPGPYGPGPTRPPPPGPQPPGPPPPAPPGGYGGPPGPRPGE